MTNRVLGKNMIQGIVILSPLLSYYDENLFYYINMFYCSVLLFTLTVLLLVNDKGFKQITKKNNNTNINKLTTYLKYLILFTTFIYTGYYTLPFLLVAIYAVLLFRTPEKA